MNQKIYQVDAFTSKIFGGNPAAICPLETWLNDDILQNIALENNLSETAFYVKKGDHFELRWFTPNVEVDLCGHATLATAYVLFNEKNYQDKTIQFISPRSGKLSVTKTGDLLTLNFPADQYQKVELSAELRDCFNIKPQKVLKGKTDYMLIFETENDIKNIQPDFAKIARLEARGVIVTAKGDKVDFVSRFFAPQCSVNEDPVTGSAHTTLTPYWAKELGKTELSAIQLSERKGHLQCKLLGERVEISGEGRLYLRGHIFIE